MRRIIAFIMIAVMLIGTMYVMAEDTDSDLKTGIDSRAEALLTLEIIEGFAPKAEVTRYTVRNSLNKVFGNDIISEKFFGESYIDQAVSLDNLLAVLLDALGYTDYIGVKWNGYNQVSRYAAAKAIGLISSGTKIDRELDMQLYVELIWKSLFEVNTYDVSNVTDNIGNINFVYTEGKTLGERCLGLSIVTGIINGIDSVNIKSGIMSENGIVIGGDYYKIKIFDIERYIGRYAECVVNKDTAVAAAVRIPEQKNYVWSFRSEDFDNKSTLSKIYYYNEQDKLKNVVLDDVDVVFNGVCVEKPSDAVLRQEDAIYTLIDNDKDGRAEVVLIDVYDVARVEIISKGSESVYLTAKNGKNYDFKKFYEDGRNVLDAKGNQVEWNEITSNDILLIRREILNNNRENDGMIDNINAVRWSMDKVNGSLDSIGSDKRNIIVGGVKYKAVPELLNNQDKMKSLKAGDDVTCYMDIFGRIADIDIYNSSAKAAAIIKMGFENHGLESKVLMKCLTEDNKVEILKLKKDVLLDGKKVSSEELLGTKYGYKFFTNGKIIEQLVKIKVNATGEVSSVTTADGVENDDFWKMSAPLTASYYDAWGVRTMNGKYVADSKTKVFTVYTDKDEFSNASPTGSISTSEYTLYCVDEDSYHVGYVLNPYKSIEGSSNEYVWGTNTAYLVLENGTKLDTRDGENVPYLLCWNGSKQVELVCKSPTLTSTRRTDNSLAFLAANSKGSNYLYKNLLKQVGWSGWKARAFQDLKPGTVINANISDGYVSSFDICFAPDFVESDLKNGTWNSLPFEGIPGYNNNNSNYGLGTDKFYHQLIYAYGEVQRLSAYGPIVNNHLPTNSEIRSLIPAGTTLNEDTAQEFMNDSKNTGIFPLADWERLYPIDTTAKIWFYNFNTGKMFSGDFSDLASGDRAFVKRTDSSMLMIVYRVD